MLKFKTFEEFNEPEQQTYTDQYVIDHVINITPEESDIPHWFIDKLMKGRTFIKKQLKITDIIESDSDFKEALEGFDENPRYEEDEVEEKDLYLPVVVVDGELLDGYSRISELLKRGEESVEAYVAI